MEKANPSSANPYRWEAHRPVVEIARPGLLQDCLHPVLQGAGAILLGAKGMGKSVLIRQLELATAAVPACEACRFRGPPAPFTLDACMHMLAAALGVRWDGRADVLELVSSWYDAHGDNHLVLLFDDVDQFTRLSAPIARSFFNAIESARREVGAKLGVFAAGGLPVYLLRDALGSPFPSRAHWITIRPFTETELRALAKPLLERQPPLSEEALEAVRVASGGHPALATYAFQRAWSRSASDAYDIASDYEHFEGRHAPFVRSVQESVSDESLSGAPARILNVIKRSPGAVARAEVLAEVSGAGEQVRINLEDALRILQAAGLVVVEGSDRADPLNVRPAATLLNLPGSRACPEGALNFRSWLGRDIDAVLGAVHSLAPDFFRAGAGSKMLVPEGVFSAVLAIALRNGGWEVEREALHGAGRTDLKVKRTGMSGLAIVELKIWGRNDYADIHRQVCDYWSKGVTTGFAIMLSDSPPERWGVEYSARCLQGYEVTEKPHATPVAFRFEVESVTNDGAAAVVDHLLLRIPRRA